MAFLISNTLNTATLRAHIKKMLLTQVSAAANNICGGHNVKKRVLVRFYKMQGQLIYEALQWLLRCRGVYGLSYLLLVIIV